MATDIDRIAYVPSEVSELGPFAAHIKYYTIVWGCVLGNKAYAGTQYATNETYGIEDQDLVHFGRATLQEPYEFSTDAAAPFSGSAGAAAPVGEIDPAETPDRYYRISWANEKGQDITLIGGDPAITSATDARNQFNSAPVGGFGPMSGEEVHVSIAAPNTHVALTDFDNWTAPTTDYPVTHVYVWGSPDSKDSGGIFRFIGKVPIADVATAILYDTLSAATLAGRIQHVDEWLAVPSFTSCCTWSNRLCGVGGGVNIRFNTDSYDVYANIDATNKKKITLASTSGGTVYTGYAWPRCMEHSGMKIQIAGDSTAYEVDMIDENDRTILYLVSDYQGTTGNGKTFDARGANNLYICAANVQQQEQCRVGFVINGWQQFNDQIQCVIASPKDEFLIVGCRQSIWSVRNVPQQEAIDAPLLFTGYIESITKDHGILGANAACAGDGVIWAMDDSALLAITATDAIPFSNDIIRELLRTFSFIDKARTVVRFDGTRQLVYVILSYLWGEDRPANGNPAKPDEGPTFFTGIETNEWCFAFDTQHKSWAVWFGGRWQTAAVCPPAGEGNTSTGSGGLMLMQDYAADVVRLSERKLVDKATASPDLYEMGGEVTSFGSGYVVLDAYLDPYLRGVYAFIVEGDNYGSYAKVTIRDLPGRLIISAWSDGDPAVGDYVLVGAMDCNWQSGTLRPRQASQHGITGYHLDMDINYADASYFRVQLQAFSGGLPTTLPGRNSPSRTKLVTRGQIRSGATLPLGATETTSRMIAGVQFFQLQQEGITDASDSRIRLNRVEVHTTEDIPEDA